MHENNSLEHSAKPTVMVQQQTQWALAVAQKRGANGEYRISIRKVLYKVL
jgi:hypothetical protein